MEKLYKWGRRTWSLIPGVSVIFKNLWLPSEISHSVAGGILEAVGVMTLIIFEISRNKQQGAAVYSHKKEAVFFLIISLVAFFGYVAIYDSQVVYNSKYDTTIMIPFWKSDELSFMIEKSHGAKSAISSYGPEAIRDAIQGNVVGFTATKIIFNIVYISIFESLVLAFSFIALDNETKLKAKPRKRAARNSDSQ